MFGSTLRLASTSGASGPRAACTAPVPQSARWDPHGSTRLRPSASTRPAASPSTVRALPERASISGGFARRPQGLCDRRPRPSGSPRSQPIGWRGGARTWATRWPPRPCRPQTRAWCDGRCTRTSWTGTRWDRPPTSTSRPTPGFGRPKPSRSTPKPHSAATTSVRTTPPKTVARPLWLHCLLRRLSKCHAVFHNACRLLGCATGVLT